MTVPAPPARRTARLPREASRAARPPLPTATGGASRQLPPCRVGVRRRYAGTAQATSSTTGLPVGVRLVAARWREDLLLQVSRTLEQALPWSGRRPTSA
ncbi:hypothetical protein [Streptomyces sp. NPDC101237]|uniref:hypothetical protein n=1 Tax=Streptomyces sp. NPDC101237 TaxID=3366139 RepID=UPI00380006D4